MTTGVGRRTYYPKDGRRPFVIDPPWVILKRLKAGRRVRSILYGLPSETVCPCWGDKGKHGYYKREMQWAFLIREYVGRLTFRYSRLLEEARKFVEKYGRCEFPVDEPKETALEIDLDLLKAYENHLKVLRADEETWKNAQRFQDPAVILAGVAENEAKSLLLAHVCPSCGGDTPCEECGVPDYEIDGQGGIRPVAR